MWKVQEGEEVPMSATRAHYPASGRVGQHSMSGDVGSVARNPSQGRIQPLGAAPTVKDGSNSELVWGMYATYIRVFSGTLDSSRLSALYALHGQLQPPEPP